MRAKSVFKKIFNIFLTVFLIALIAIIVLTLVLRITGNTPSVAGYMIFRVSSGSMEPQLNVGDIILSKEMSDISELKPGDIVSYKGMHGDTQGKLITHKVVKGAYSEDGKKYIVTRGIANSDDDAPVSEEQIVGVMLCKVPLLGELYGFFLTPWGLIVAIALILLAFSGEFWNIFKLSRGERDDTPEISEDTVQKAVESYKKEKEKSALESGQAQEKLILEQPCDGIEENNNDE